MKSVLLFLLSAFSLSTVATGQMKDIESQLCESFSNINYLSNHNGDYDSLRKANRNFEEFLLHSTQTNPGTINYKFKNLIDKGAVIVTSEDNLFRIYSWDTRECGTCRAFNAIFQYKDKRGTHSFPALFNKEQDPPDNGCSFYQMNNIIIDGKAYYIVQSIIIGSSAVYGYSINIFTINDNGLTDRTNLFKTKTGFVSDISYGFDLSSASNKGLEIHNIDLGIHYDKVHNVISFPATDGDKIFNYRIRYKFNGHYFEII